MKEMLNKISRVVFPNLPQEVQKNRNKVKLSVVHTLENPLIGTHPITINMLEGRKMMTLQERECCPKGQYQFHIKIDFPQNGTSDELPSITLYSKDGAIKQMMILSLPRNSTQEGIINAVTIELRMKLQEYVEGKLLKKMVIVKGSGDSIGEASHQDFREIEITTNTLEGARITTLSQIFLSSRRELPKNK